MPRKPMSEEMLRIVARRFRMLGEPNRLRILETLESGEKTVSEIVAARRASQANISKHLQALTDAGLIRRRRQGNFVYYSIADPVVHEICELVCRSAARHVRARFTALLPKRKAS